MTDFRECPRYRAGEVHPGPHWWASGADPGKRPGMYRRRCRGLPDTGDRLVAGRYELGEQVGSVGGPGACDAGGASYVILVVDGEPVQRCRCIVCGRCGRHTGNATQGHYWAWCKVRRGVVDFHFCCPGSCSLDIVLAVPPEDADGVV